MEAEKIGAPGIVTREEFESLGKKVAALEKQIQGQPIIGAGTVTASGCSVTGLRE